jgi:hypothetical protein
MKKKIVSAMIGGHPHREIGGENSGGSTAVTVAPTVTRNLVKLEDDEGAEQPRKRRRIGGADKRKPLDPTYAYRINDDGSALVMVSIHVAALYMIVAFIKMCKELMRWKKISYNSIVDTEMERQTLCRLEGRTAGNSYIRK